jgi:hypothetical protein
MIVQQPEIPTALLLRFPFPAWATRRDEVREDRLADEKVFEGLADFDVSAQRTVVKQRGGA